MGKSEGLQGARILDMSHREKPGLITRLRDLGSMLYFQRQTSRPYTYLPKGDVQC